MRERERERDKGSSHIEVFLNGREELLESLFHCLLKLSVVLQCVSKTMDDAAVTP